MALNWYIGIMTTFWFQDNHAEIYLMWPSTKNVQPVLTRSPGCIRKEIKLQSFKNHFALKTVLILSQGNLSEMFLKWLTTKSIQFQKNVLKNIDHRQRQKGGKITKLIKILLWNDWSDFKIMWQKCSFKFSGKKLQPVWWNQNAV